MSVALPKTPTVEELAKAWTRHFAAAVRAGGGRDGRISLSEARKIATFDGPLAYFSDNVVNYLEAKGQKTVSINKLIAAGYRYCYACAADVAGSNRKVSFKEARSMPEDLRADFLLLRGKLAPQEPAALTAARKAELKSAFEAAYVIDGIYLDLPHETIERDDLPESIQSAFDEIASHTHRLGACTAHPIELDGEPAYAIFSNILMAGDVTLYTPDGQMIANAGADTEMGGFWWST